MPLVPATAEVLPIELDGVSKLKVEVFFLKGSELARMHKLDKGGKLAETPVLSGKLRVTYWLLMEKERRTWS